MKGLVLFLSFAFPTAALAVPDVFDCRPVGVADGDTFTCLDDNREQFRIRLHQIDAPEKSQAFGQVAKQALSRLIWHKRVTVRVWTTDRYGRLVAEVFADGNNVNKSMVAGGYAWAYRRYLKPADRAEYLRLEAAARAGRRGLWADAHPINPADFRHR